MQKICLKKYWLKQITKISESNRIEKCVCIQLNSVANKEFTCCFRRNQINHLMYIHCGMAVFVFLCILVFFPSQPPSPPSPTAAADRLSFIVSFLVCFVCTLRIINWLDFNPETTTARLLFGLQLQNITSAFLSLKEWMLQCVLI